MPPARFGRAVNRIFGLTPVQLIAKTRIAAASLALRDTPRAVAEVAHACGFSDHSALLCNPWRSTSEWFTVV
ncbi:MAG: helix-turn-helix domain-containing protein [Opitutaceae bacterium]